MAANDWFYQWAGGNSQLTTQVPNYQNITVYPNNTGIQWQQGIFRISSSPTYTFGFTGFQSVGPIEEEDPFDKWARECRQIQSLLDEIQGS